MMLVAKEKLSKTLVLLPQNLSMGDIKSDHELFESFMQVLCVKVSKMIDGTLWLSMYQDLAEVLISSSDKWLLQWQLR